MMETKRRREQRSILPVHPDAAAIDIGATVHVAAVGPARDPEPVRSFGTFTGICTGLLIGSHSAGSRRS